MLIVLVLIESVTFLMMLFMAEMPAAPSYDASAKWVFRFSAAECAFVVVLIIATLVIRTKGRSNACLIWTKAFNIFLLLIFPLGTIVGVYGLRKLDKPQYLSENTS